MAGPLDMRSGRPPSCATIIASVVLPSPGGPASRMWSGVRCCMRRGREQQLQLPAHAGLPDELREAARAQRALEGELGLGREHGVGEVEVAVVGAVGHRALPACCAGPSRERVRRSTAGTEAASTSDAAAMVSSTASAATRSDQPSPMSAARTLSATPPVATVEGACRDVRRDELAGQGQGDELRGLRADAADLAEHRVVVALHGRGDLLGRERRQHAERRLRARRP